MERFDILPRSDWKQKLEAIGFDWHSIYDAPYWDESKFYSLSLDEIEGELEDPTQELIGLVYESVGEIISSPNVGEILTRLQIPHEYHDAVIASWKNNERDLYGRFDFSYSGIGPAKMLEFNADTPTSLYESAVVQWQWLEDLKSQGILHEDVDQFNSIHDRLVDAFTKLDLPDHMHFAAFLDSPEDGGTAAYLADIATQVGKTSTIIDIRNVGVDADDYFTDVSDYRIDAMFKLYPWEHMMREDFGPITTRTKTRLIEPMWKSIVSNKGFLAILWQHHRGHRNLLPTFFEDDPEAHNLEAYARKPFFSREGANVTLMQDGFVLDREPGKYGDEGYIRQALSPLPKFVSSHTVTGSWVVAGQASGICFREDVSLITKDTSLFIPHIIV